ncbi:hypothetical protein JXD38_03160 [candidate division WOR-3 bacterium]|nr:hypothetical protein [candidate division WOR-3 bacterium]
MRRAAVVLLLVACALAAAQTHAAVPDTVSRGEVVLAAQQALAGASRNLSRWLTFVIIAVLAAAAIAVWRIWALGRQVARLSDMRAAWETRFSGTADEVLRLKRKVADAETKVGKLETDMASVRPAELDAATAQVAMVQFELAAVRERLDRAEGNLEAVADHTVVTKQERAVIEDLVKTAAEERTRVEDLVRAATEAQAAADAASVRTEAVSRRTAAVDALRSGDEALARQQYPTAVQAYTFCLESLEGRQGDEPGFWFHALHGRALANLRQREFGKVLADAAKLEKVGTDRARGAGRLLAGIARLWQGDVAHAIKEFAAANTQDPGARGVILQDEDIATWVKVNPRKAGPLKKFLRVLDRKPAHRRH